MAPKLQPIKIGRAEVHLSAILLFVLSFYLKFLDKLMLTYAVTVLHELAHIFVAKKLGVDVLKVEILPFGITMRLTDVGIKNPKDEIKISLAGPISNLLIVFFLNALYNGPHKDFIFTTSLVMGVFNLLPILPLDGGRVLRCVLIKKYGYIRAMSITLSVTKAFSVVLIFLGAFLLWLTKFNFSVLLIGSFLVANITEERKNANLIIMKDILYSRKKLAQKGVTDAGVIAVSQDESAKKVLLKLTYDKYFLIHIIDRDMKLKHIVTETELIEKLSVLGPDISMRKIVEF